ncbi:MAG: dipeptide ABC transporter ATP-binding protein [Candidatus Competibacteraceae bacterium]|nr:dipeptide ABC transporter ATP-binding protein [Candidatus Competibacteraceae bacterium]
MTLLTINDLSVQFGTRSAPFRAVDGVELSLEPGEVVGIVGESGSGKSVMSLAIMGLIDYPGRVTAERMVFAERDLLTMSASERRKLLGKDIAMIFQDPMTSLNPCYTVGFQIMETLKVHEGGSRAELRQRAVQLLEQVGIPDPASRLRAFPHQLSGGMSQRVVIAMAIACSPQLLIADEPTTALDVTIQAQIMDLLKDLQAQRGMALLLITHDLAVVAETCERVVVMYAGQIVETGRVEEVFKVPSHPYTAALLNALPERSEGQHRLSTIAGVVPGQYDRPNGCLLNPRCEFATDRCVREQPRLRSVADRQVRCHTPLDAAGRPSHD